MADFAGVSQEIMAAVMEDDEDLSAVELFKLARYLGVRAGYLLSPELSMVDPSTNKGKARLRQLLDLMSKAKAIDDDLLWWQMIERVRNDLQRGDPVTYASWCWACNNIEDALERKRRKERKPRSTRLEKEGSL